MIEKDEQINELEDYRTEATKEHAQDRQQLSSLEETTETIEADIDDLTDAEEKNSRVRASVSHIINLVRDYKIEEGVDDESPNLAAEASWPPTLRDNPTLRTLNCSSLQMVAQLGYREVATHYDCAYKNDGYRVMEEVIECVPGVTYKETRTLSIDDATSVGGHHIEITFAHPDL